MVLLNGFSMSLQLSLGRYGGICAMGLLLAFNVQLVFYGFRLDLFGRWTCLLSLFLSSLTLMFARFLDPCRGGPPTSNGQP